MLYKNKFFVKRDYECGNIVFAETTGEPPLYDNNGELITDNRWILCDKSELSKLGCKPLFIQAGTQYYGWN